MKHWKETAEILARTARVAEAGGRAAIAMVVRVEGSAYRRPGAKFLVEESGATAGGVSGGCLEGDVREVALEVLRSGEPRLLRYETGDDESVFGLGLGCSGTVEIFVSDATSPEALETSGEILGLLRGDRPFAVSTVLRGAAAGTVTLHPGGAASSAPPPPDRDVFVETYAPPPALVIFGGADDAIPLAAYASASGFRVTVVDHRPAALLPGRFAEDVRLDARRPEAGTGGLPLGPRSFAVVKMHSFAHDREWARSLRDAGVPYVGLLGPRERGRKILTQIGAEAGERFFAPVGLDLGAEGPEQIAVAIVGELLAVHASRQPWSLREKEGAIHAG
ncbi:MAG TPA: XdhC family protein [Thermoanaerobaculia bacterium]|jgi:xanthine dehydrogenase accessory factor